MAPDWQNEFTISIHDFALSFSKSFLIFFLFFCLQWGFKQSLALSLEAGEAGEHIVVTSCFVVKKQKQTNNTNRKQALIFTQFVYSRIWFQKQIWSVFFSLKKCHQNNKGNNNKIECYIFKPVCFMLNRGCFLLVDSWPKSRSGVNRVSFPLLRIETSSG